MTILRTVPYVLFSLAMIVSVPAVAADAQKHKQAQADLRDAKRDLSQANADMSKANKALAAARKRLAAAEKVYPAAEQRYRKAHAAEAEVSRRLRAEAEEDVRPEAFTEMYNRAVAEEDKRRKELLRKLASDEDYRAAIKTAVDRRAKLAAQHEQRTIDPKKVAELADAILDADRRVSELEQSYLTGSSYYRAAKEEADEVKQRAAEIEREIVRTIEQDPEYARLRADAGPKRVKYESAKRDFEDARREHASASSQHSSAERRISDAARDVKKYEAEVKRHKPKKK